jgi:hypothetical protein
MARTASFTKREIIRCHHHFWLVVACYSTAIIYAQLAACDRGEDIAEVIGQLVVGGGVLSGSGGNLRAALEWLGVRVANLR